MESTSLVLASTEFEPTKNNATKKLKPLSEHDRQALEALNSAIDKYGIEPDFLIIMEYKLLQCGVPTKVVDKEKWRNLAYPLFTGMKENSKRSTFTRCIKALIEHKKIIASESDSMGNFYWPI